MWRSWLEMVASLHAYVQTKKWCRGYQRWEQLRTAAESYFPAQDSHLKALHRAHFLRASSKSAGPVSDNTALEKHSYRVSCEARAGTAVNNRAESGREIMCWGIAETRSDVSTALEASFVQYGTKEQSTHTMYILLWTNKTFVLKLLKAHLNHFERAAVHSKSFFGMSFSDFSDLERVIS